MLSNLRRARKGAAPGPFGFTAEIARVVLDDEESSQAFVDVATLLAQAQIPPAILPAFGLGRVVALTKPSGGTRGLVVGDFFKCIVGHTLAQQFAGTVEEAFEDPVAREDLRSSTAQLHMSRKQVGAAQPPGNLQRIRFELDTLAPESPNPKEARNQTFHEAWH